MRKKIFILLLLVAGCTEFLVEIDDNEDWLVNESGNFVIHYRAPEFGFGESPTNEIISIIGENQNHYLNIINDTLGINYGEKVLIYLFNKQEADEKIGTSGGGHSIPVYNAYYYTYSGLAFTDRFTDTAYIGSHELVHVVTHKLLGAPGTKMLSEGYAVALDGGYALTGSGDGSVVRKSIDAWMNEFGDSGNILSPGTLLNNDDLPENIYYPNAGSFISYLFDRFGSEKINSLFTVEKDNFKEKFNSKLNVNFNIAAEDYLEYCNNRYK